ncbi:MAG: TIGR03619 family F420-dependent LLM class oxidoreductase [Pseudomonadales bacterium]
MKLGVTLRNMGPQSSAAIMAGGAEAAEARGFESLWITDHIAIPPDDAEGSGGRYTDPLTTLAWLAGRTRAIGLGTGVLILPYRSPLPTVKQVATVQELSGGRLLLGVGIGWMAAEFRALGVPLSERVRRSEEVLTLLADCFAGDVVSRHGQPFIFSPRPAPPPVYVGGRAPHALDRALRFGHGWLPMTRDPDALGADLAQFAALAAEQGRTSGPVTAMAGLPLDDGPRAAALLGRYRALGIERLVCTLRYRTLDDYQRQLDVLAALRDREV